jgi:hypothetical protein
MATTAITLLDVENARYKDFFYGLFFNTTIRNNVYHTILEIVREQTIKGTAVSNRLDVTFNRLRTRNVACAIQHSFVFFAMAEEKAVRDYVLCNVHGEQRKEEVKQFFDNDLTILTEKLLNGHFASLLHFVDEVRFEIFVKLGFQHSAHSRTARDGPVS